MLNKHSNTKQNNSNHLKEDQNTSVSNQGKSSMFNWDECDHSCKTKKGLKTLEKHYLKKKDLEINLKNITPNVDAQQ